VASKPKLILHQMVTRNLLDRKVAAPVQTIENTAVGIRHADHVAPSIRAKVGNHFAEKRRTQTMEFSFFFL
jgi:hypothetical protein